MASELGTVKSGRLRIFLLLFGSFVILITAGAVSVGYCVQRYWETVLRDEITRNLTQKTRMFAAQIESDHARQVADITSQAGHDAGARATVIDGNGKVLADSEVPVASLEQEGHSPEFAKALHGEVGVATRRQGHFGVAVLYVAAPVSGGAVRLAYPLADVAIARSESRHTLLIGAGIVVLAALAISALAARAISAR